MTAFHSGDAAHLPEPPPAFPAAFAELRRLLRHERERADRAAAANERLMGELEDLRRTLAAEREVASAAAADAARALAAQEAKLFEEQQRADERWQRLAEEKLEAHRKATDEKIELQREVAEWKGEAHRHELAVRTEKELREWEVALVRESEPTWLTGLTVLLQDESARSLLGGVVRKTIAAREARAEERGEATGEGEGLALPFLRWLADGLATEVSLVEASSGDASSMEGPPVEGPPVEGPPVEEGQSDEPPPADPA